jgi:hypothetical protein
VRASRSGQPRATDLLEESVEGSLTSRPHRPPRHKLDLDRVLVIGAPEAAERLFRLARPAVAQ